MIAPSCGISIGLFPRLLGVVYLLAFGSLFVQVRGLYGARGILPIRDHVAALRLTFGTTIRLRLPSLFWFAANDAFITGCAAAGVCLSLLLVAGLLTMPALILLWLIYLSFAAMGQEFLSYQWDALLLEAGFMTIFLPLVSPPPPLVCLACQFFIFRFMFSAGAVKLTSGDPNWRNLRAMCVHYETQPIPNRIAWYAHQLPERLQRLSTLATLFFELIVPFLALGPAPCRLACFCLLLFFQGLIFLTGNYGFFNILTIVLAVPLLDDRYLGPAGLVGLLPASMPPAPFMVGLVSVIFSAFILLNGLQLLRLFVRPHWLSRILAACGPWYVSSPYGLFAVMTTKRFEFVIEGSNDLNEWQPYEFRWKPGDTLTPPRQAAPHQPRLDWQMWFAALDPTHVEPWLVRLVQRLLEGSPPVMSLFGTVPFRDAPPAAIRLVVYRYHLSAWATRRATARWWDRSRVGMSAPMSLPSGPRAASRG
ncbi:MAG TPA: lipase maturation factor family protein [Desulfuromonadaceae bacterium]